MTMRWLMVLTVTGATACGGGEPAGGAAAPTSTADGPATCVQIMTRARACEAYLPALVDLRIELDQPAGIRAQADAQGRDALIAEAQAEWAVDSTDERIAATCAQAPSAPALIEAADRCLATTACDAFVPCSVDLMRQAHQP